MAFLDYAGLAHFKRLLDKQFKNKINTPVNNGTSGKILRSRGGSETYWADPVTPEELSGAVQEWMDENVTPTSSTVLIDETLTQAGAAAQAKAAGGLVKVSYEQPEESSNKLWIEPRIDEVVLATYKDLETTIQRVASVSKSDAENIDLDVADQDGNVVLRLKDGHIQTKEFNSANTAVIDDQAGSGDTDKVWSADKTSNLVQKDNAVITGSLSMGRDAIGDVGLNSMANGIDVRATERGSHAEGYSTDSTGEYSHTEGYDTQAYGRDAHAEGNWTLARAEGSHAEGYRTESSGIRSHAEGYMTESSGEHSHSEGGNTESEGQYAHAEGDTTSASGKGAHSEGYHTSASGEYAHSEGCYTSAAGNYSHSFGKYSDGDSYMKWPQWTKNTDYVVGDKIGIGRSITDGQMIRVIYEGYVCHTNHTSGNTFDNSYWTNQNGMMEHVEVVGNGTDTNHRSNARTLDWQGNEELAGDLTVNKGTPNETSVNLLKNDISSVRRVINTVPNTKLTESEDVDLDIADADGYVIARFADGHIETKNFNSKDVSAEAMIKLPRTEGTNASNIDLDIADNRGNVLLRLDSGHITSKNFSSKDFVGIIAANESDVGKILKVKAVENNKVVEWEFAETSGGSDDIMLNVPHKLYATQGIEYNIYFENICENWERYTWNVNCAKGMQLERGYRVTPVAAEVGEYPITITATRIDNPSIYKEVTSTLIVSAESAGTSETVSVIVLGDSTTDYGVAVTKLHLDIDGTGMTLETLGTRGNAPNKHEGRSGWSFKDYCTKATDSTDQSVVNPFYNPTTQKFDASYYFANSGVSTPDWFIINLGINDMFGTLTDTALEASINTTIGYAEDMINSILAASQNIKVGICLTIPPNHSQDAFGKEYRCSQTRNRYKRNNTMFVNRLISEYDNRESERIYIVPINTALDTVYNMTLETIPVNARNTAITYQSPIGNAGVHPNEFGSWQVADVYAALIKGTI